MSDPLFGPMFCSRQRRGNSISAAEQLIKFIYSKPETTRRFETRQPYIGQRSGAGEKSTCYIASRLNALIGLGSISTEEASTAHTAIVDEPTLVWQQYPPATYLSPLICTGRIESLFNKLDTIPVRLEYSNNLSSREISAEDKIKIIGSIGTSDIALIMGLEKIDHALAVVAESPSYNNDLTILDSRNPSLLQESSVSEIIHIFDDDPTSKMQLIYSTPK